MVAHSSSWRAEFVLRASERCLVPSAPMLLIRRLRVWAKSECQWLLTVGIARALAHPRAVIVVFVFRRSAMICAPSTPSLLPLRLREVSKGARQNASR